MLIPLLITWLVAVGPARAKLPASKVPISVEVIPSVCLVPCAVRIEVIIQPDLENRRARVELDGPTYRASEIPLEGASAPKRYTLPYVIFTEGVYEVRGMLYNSTREISRQVRTLIVSGNHR